MSAVAAELREEIYTVQLAIAQLTAAFHATAEATARQELLRELAAHQQQLVAAEAQLAALTQAAGTRGVLLAVQKAPAGATTRGSATTGLEATVRLKMAHVPTGIYHLLNPQEHPLLTCELRNSSSQTRRLRVTSSIEGYSAQAIDTVELPANAAGEITQLPTLFPERLRDLHELTRATLNILVDDLDGKVESQQTAPIWLLARNAAPLYVRDPATDRWNNLTRYLGAFVTPNEPSVMAFLRKAAARHEQGQLFGYQEGRAVEAQVRAIYMALQADAGITYVNSTVNFNPDQSARTQRVRLPRQSLAEQQANCIDGVLLFASLLEAASLSPALVIIPGHALVAWETGKKSGQWAYLETTKIGALPFAEALTLGQDQATAFAGLPTASQSFIRWPLRELRAEHGITPLE